jgi:hypothetical protein
MHRAALPVIVALPEAELSILSFMLERDLRETATPRPKIKLLRIVAIDLSPHPREEELAAIRRGPEASWDRD